MKEAAPSSLAGSPSRLRPWILAALGVGILLRAWEATGTLWLDELHTLSHASRATLGEVVAAVRLDNHTPAFFGFVHLFGGWEQGAWLRWIPILASLATLPFLALLMRGSGRGPLAVGVALWLAATLPYQVHFGAELRPYAWLGLFSAVACWAAFAESGSRVLRFAVFVAAVFLGMSTHRLMAISVFSIGAARLVVRRREMLGLRWLILAGAIGVAPALPWLLDFAQTATEGRLEHAEEVGGYRLRPVLVREVAALPLRLVVPVMGFLGGAWAWLARAGTLLVFGGLALGACEYAVRRVQRSAPRMPWPLVASAVYAAIAFVLISALSLWSWDRVPLQYYAGVAWVLPMVAAELVLAPRAAWLRRAAVAATCAGSLVAGAALAGGSSREEVRGAVACARELGEQAAREAPGAPPIYTALLAQPGEVFANLLPYRAYARDLPAVEPADLPRPGDPGFERPVVVVRRVLPIDHPKWSPILTGRTISEQVRIDRYMTVYVMRPVTP